MPHRASRKNSSLAAAGLILATGLSLGLLSSAHPRKQSQDPGSAHREAVITTHAVGTFEVKLTPQPPEDKAQGTTLARMSIDKQFHGDLEAVSRGQMLTAGTSVQGSAGYVAIERITGSLRGRTGSFILQHSGTLTRGAPQQSITVVPDSGTGQLAGLNGKMTIQIDAGKHSYQFDYFLPDAP